MKWYRRARDRAYPCLTAEVVEGLAARQGLGTLPTDTQAFSGPFSRHEKLFYHLVLFLMGTLSLVIIDLSGTPDHLWFWPWTLGWALVLLIHAGYVLLAERSSGAQPTKPAR